MKVILMTINVIATIPPYASFMDEVLDHKSVSGVFRNGLC